MVLFIAVASGSLVGLLVPTETGKEEVSEEEETNEEVELATAVEEAKFGVDRLV